MCNNVYDYKNELQKKDCIIIFNNNNDYNITSLISEISPVLKVQFR